MLFLRHTAHALVIFSLLSTTKLVATTFKANDSVDNPMMQMPKDIRRTPRVRIAVEIQPFKKAVMRGIDGKKKIQFLKSEPLKRMLRARIKETNHFYLDDWHIQTTPVAWDKSTKVLTMKLKYYKQFGQVSKVEEFVGESVVKGYLTGSDGIYLLNGQSKRLFKNKSGDPVINVTAGFSPKQASEVATSPKQTSEKSIR
jgi:hypothetical protein